MKVFKPVKDDTAEWLTEASKLHKHIKHAKVPITKTFPRQEYLHPLSAVDSTIKMKVIEFLNFDTTHLIGSVDLDKLLSKAEKAGIDRGNILYMELHDIYSRAQELRKIIQQYSACAHKTYAEAKFLFAEILQIGIWIEEAVIVKKIIQVNKKIEKFLNGSREDCLNGLKEISEADGKFIDSGFKKDIASRFQEIDVLQRRIDGFLGRAYLDFGDFEPLEQLVKESQLYPYFIPHFETLLSLHKSFVWVLELGVKFGMKTTSLSNLVSQLIGKIHQIKDKPEFSTYREKLFEANKFGFSLSPLTQVIQEAKVLFWNSEAQSLLTKGNYKLAELDCLILRAPNSTHGQIAIFNNLKNQQRKAQHWKEEVERLVRQATDLRTCSTEEFTKRMNSSLTQIEDALSKVVDEYKGSLNQIEEFVALKAELDFSEKIITMCKCIHRMNINKKIEHTDYARAKELFKDPASKAFRNDNLFNAFKQVLKLFNKEMKVLQGFYLKIVDKGTHATPDLFEPKFLAYAKTLTNVDEIVEALNKVEDFISLNQFGIEIKTFVSDFKRAEASLLTIMQECSLDELGLLDCVKLQELIAEFNKCKQLMHVRVFSQHLEPLARYEWYLHAVEGLRSDQASLEVLERLRMCADIAQPDERDITQLIKNKIKRGRTLVEEVQQLLNSGNSLTVSDLKDIKVRLDDSRIIVKALKKQVDQEYKAYEMVERDFNDAKDSGSDGYVNTTEELRGLLKDVQSMKYKAPEMEAELSQAIESSERLLLHAEQLRPIAEINEAIESYRKSGIRSKEAENLLKHKQLALEFLQREDLGIERMSMQELRLLEKSIVNSLDKSYNDKLADKILRRKYMILMHLEKKVSDEPAPGVIKIEDFKSLYELMKAKPNLFNSDELEYMTEKIYHVSLYVTELKKLSASQLLRAKRILFNYLDLTEEYRAVQKIHGVQTASSSHLPQVFEKPSVLIPSVKPPPVQSPPKSSSRDMKLEKIEKSSPQKLEPILEREDNLTTPQPADLPLAILDPLEKSEKKLMRKELVKQFRNNLMRLVKISKEDATEKSQVLEAFIYSQCKQSLMEYKARIQDYEKLIEKAHNKPFLIELLANRPIQPKLVAQIVDDEDFIALQDEFQARRYLRNFGQSASAHKHHKDKQDLDNSSLGKRRLPLPFSEEEIDILEGASEKRLKRVSEEEKKHNINLGDDMSPHQSSVFVEKVRFVEDVDDELIEDTPEISDSESRGEVHHITIDPTSAGSKFHITEVPDDTHEPSQERENKYGSANKSEEESHSSKKYEAPGSQRVKEASTKDKRGRLSANEKLNSLSSVRKNLNTVIESDLLKQDGSESPSDRANKSSERVDSLPAVSLPVTFDVSPATGTVAVNSFMLHLAYADASPESIIQRFGIESDVATDGQVQSKAVMSSVHSKEVLTGVLKNAKLKLASGSLTVTSESEKILMNKVRDFCGEMVLGGKTSDGRNLFFTKPGSQASEKLKELLAVRSKGSLPDFRLSLPDSPAFFWVLVEEENTKGSDEVSAKPLKLRKEGSSSSKRSSSLDWSDPETPKGGDLELGKRKDGPTDALITEDPSNITIRKELYLDDSLIDREYAAEAVRAISHNLDAEAERAGYKQLDATQSAPKGGKKGQPDQAIVIRMEYRLS